MNDVDSKLMSGKAEKGEGQLGTEAESPKGTGQSGAHSRRPLPP